MSQRNPSGSNSFWGSFPSFDLPNVSGATVQTTNLVVGHLALDTTLGQMVFCTNATQNAATWVALAAGGGGGANYHSQKIIIGNQANGDSVNDCTHLDTGSGAVLQSTINGAAGNVDIYIRPGAYGPITGLMTLATGVSVMGGGNSVVISRASTGDQRLFSLGANARLSGISITVPKPTASGTGGCLIGCVGTDSSVSDVDVTFANHLTYTLGEANNLLLNSVFCADRGTSAVFTRCKTITPALGLTASSNRIASFRANSSPAGTFYDSVSFTDCHGVAGDYGLWILGRAKAVGCTIDFPNEFTFLVSNGTAIGSIIDGNSMSILGDSITGSGKITTDNVIVSNNLIEVDYISEPASPKPGLEITGDANVISGNVISGVRFDGNANIFTSNKVPIAEVRDFGLGNTIAHNG